MDKSEAPTNDPRAGKAAVASLAGAGAGASVWAEAALMEAAATRATQAIFFISILNLRRRKDQETREMWTVNEFLVFVSTALTM